MSNFLKKLFHKKEVPEPGGAGVVLSVEAIFSDVLGQNLTLITGRGADVDLKRIPHSTFESLPVLDKAGVFYNTFRRSDGYPFAFFIPEAAFDELKSVFAGVHGEAPDKVPPSRVCAWLDGNLSRLFYLESAEEETPENRWQVMPFLALPKSYHHTEKDEALWRFAGSTVFDVTAGGYEFFILTDFHRLSKIEKHLAEEGSFRRAVRDQVMLRYTGGETTFFDRESSIRINIEKNSEFLLGRFFIPLRPRIDGKTGRTDFRSVVAAYTDGIDTESDRTRFALSFNFKDRVFQWYYSFRLTGPDQDRKRLKSIISGAMKFLGNAMNIHGVRGHFLNPDIYPDLSDHVCIEANIFIGNNTATCRVFVDSGFLTTLSELLLPSWEVDFLKRNLFVRMLSVISLNQTLFRKNIQSFYREKSTRRDDDTRPRVIRVAELLNLVPPEDYRRIVQNFLLARGHSVSTLQCLFFFECKVDADSPGKICVDAAFDSPRFLAALPRPKRDEWNRSLAASSSRQELQEMNLRTMLELYEAVKEDRIDLSYRARFILKNEFRYRVEEDYTTAIAELAGNRLYIDQLSDLPPSLAQGLLSRFPLDRLALALLADDSDRVVLDGFISRKKRGFLDEEIEFRRERYNSGDIDPREVLEAMEDLRRAVKNQFEIWKSEEDSQKEM